MQLPLALTMLALLALAAACLAIGYASGYATGASRARRASLTKRQSVLLQPGDYSQPLGNARARRRAYTVRERSAREFMQIAMR